MSRESPPPDELKDSVRKGKGSAATEMSVPTPPAEDLVGASVEAEELKEPTVAAGVLVAETISFGDTAERLLEVLLVVLVGVLLSSHWDPRAIPLALLLFLVIRADSPPWRCWRALPPPRRSAGSWVGSESEGSGACTT